MGSLESARIMPPTLSSFKQYVLGFAFDEFDSDRVVLIKKNRPEWQAGLLNGVGGKVEKYEVEIEAMVREFREETGYSTNVDEWKKVAELRDEHEEKFVVHIYAAKIDSHWVESKTDEEVVTMAADKVNRYNAVRNLEFLIPLAKLVLESDHPSLEIKEVA
jgi:8-oxo-dGTP diphosphatase